MSGTIQSSLSICQAAYCHRAFGVFTNVHKTCGEHPPIAMLIEHCTSTWHADMACGICSLGSNLLLIKHFQWCINLHCRYENTVQLALVQTNPSIGQRLERCNVVVRFLKCRCVADTDHCPAMCRELQETLAERVRQAVILPVRIQIRADLEDDVTQLLVTAPVDSGGRGRPRVTYDVTAALNRLSMPAHVRARYLQLAASCCCIWCCFL